ncbi:eukaryotic rRNA processing protein EBP2-domain-containing protein [Armillaria borealis]|uniref:Eukaryotic rRNA processing protein EBP2-domain-containing protein n=1 Tax=Armillaria borealis TaxID=47425 RepID=A0AA39MHK5_9AGAR|nr:eukaryotic rRNA processing protein EBP2-domain-containing protein [Armillaria borealis]
MVSSKSKTPEKRTKGKVIAAPIDVPAESSDSNDEDSDNGGVDEAGMERLIKALGDEGLDEFDQAQLGALGGDDESDSEGEDENGSDEEDVEGLDQENDSEEDEEEEQEADEDDAEDDEGDGEEEDVALENVEDVDDDVVPRQKIEIDNHVALARIHESIQLDTSLPWTETLVLSYPETIDVDVNDDLNREVALTLAAKHKFPFTRPSDYFAEMVKTDAHMERIRQRLLDESSGIKKSEDKRKEREGKKFGKQVQIEKLKERERSKKDMEERLKGLKRKRKDVLDNPNADDDAFDVAVEDAISDRPAKRGRGGASGGLSRQSRDKKFGFGGGDRRSKQNTRESTDNFESGSRKGGGRGGRGTGAGRGGSAGRGGGSSGGRHSSKRLGKSRRITARSKT